MAGFVAADDSAASRHPGFIAGSIDERPQLLAALPRARDRLFLILALHTGLRVSELLSLRVGQVWRGGAAVDFVDVPRRLLKGGKGAKARRVQSRRIPMHPVVVRALQECLTDTYGSTEPVAGDYLFRNMKRVGHPVGRIQAYLILRRAATAAGLVGTVSPHSLRRSFATDVYKATGNDFVATQRIIGHSSPMITAK